MMMMMLMIYVTSQYLPYKYIDIRRPNYYVT